MSRLAQFGRGGDVGGRGDRRWRGGVDGGRGEEQIFLGKMVDVENLINSKG